MHDADSPWGIRDAKTGAWTGCPGPLSVSREGAQRLERAFPRVFRAERNPADVLAEELDCSSTERIMALAQG